MAKSKGKDPGFIFYTRDFYEGTRTMLPEERACYIDLLIYQHQNGGLIPTDLKRLVMYCSGISEATLEATLEAKFKLCDKGWYNPRLQKVIEERCEFTETQSINGTVGQFFKKAKAILTKRDFLKLQEKYNPLPKKELFELINKKEVGEALLQAMLIAKPKQLADVSAIENVDEDASASAIVLGDRGMGKEPFLKKEHHFQQSEYFQDKAKWYAALPDEWPQAQKDHWWERADDWSAQKTKNKQIDWVRAVKKWNKENPWTPTGQINGSRPMTNNQRLNHIAGNGGYLAIDEDKWVKIAGSLIDGHFKLEEETGDMVMYCGGKSVRVTPGQGYASNVMYELKPGKTIQGIHKYLLEIQKSNQSSQS